MRSIVLWTGGPRVRLGVIQSFRECIFSDTYTNVKLLNDLVIGAYHNIQQVPEAYAFFEKSLEPEPAFQPEQSYNCNRGRSLAKSV